MFGRRFRQMVVEADSGVIRSRAHIYGSNRDLYTRTTDLLVQFVLVAENSRGCPFAVSTSSWCSESNRRAFSLYTYCSLQLNHRTYVALYKAADRRAARIRVILFAGDAVIVAIKVVDVIANYLGCAVEVRRSVAAATTTVHITVDRDATPRVVRVTA